MSGALARMVAASDSEEALSRPPFTAFAADEVTREALARAAEAADLEPAAVVMGSREEAREALAGVATPRLLVVDLDDAGNPMQEAAALAEVCDPGTRVILLGRVNDIGIYRALIDLGVRDYLVKPVSLEAVEHSLQQAVAPNPAPAQTTATVASPEELSVTAVVGTQGGAGASTVAGNLAWLLATERGCRTVLIDLDLVFGTQAIAFDVEPGRGLIDAFAAPGRIDPLFVRRALITVGERLFLMAGEGDPAAVPTVGAEGLEAMLEVLREDADAVVLDVPRAVAAATPELLASVQRTFLVSQPSLAGMRDTLRLKRRIAAAGSTAVELVLNRTGLAPKAELARDIFEESAETKASFVLPEDARGAAAAATAAKPLTQVATRSKLAAGLRDMAVAIVPDDETSAGPIWRRLLRRRGG